MVRTKLQRFAENSKRHNVIEPGKDIYEKIKGNWHKDFFNNNNPITLELACGRGEYTVGLARVFNGRNYIGVDIKGDRIWKGSGIALDEGLDNVAFLRTQILLIERFFEKGEVDEIWITFPDPRPKDRDEKRRLTHPRFLDIYRSILKPGGTLHLKTDNTGLFEYTLEVLQQQEAISDLVYTRDLYKSDMLADHHGIRTRYEKKFHEKGEDIKYLKLSLLDKTE
ncbi:tRNA (guanosine(46)-N7)-methyltransferase TrmB [Roseivirga sp. BDSF3-8]|uniref:tRNA (guanosine(46)-N7)-methyltransferase TrmB n=1 Tax=Roseivirga sp. BDSF3-8 TaxID=3241598 RepID=UPI0035324929